MLLIQPCNRAWQVCTLTGHKGNVICVAFSPDGKRIVSGSEDCLVKIWDVEKGKQVCSVAAVR